MAILSKIRERTFVLILVIAMALFAFVIGDAFKSGGSIKGDVVGEVNGESISRNDFSQELETYRARVGRNVSETQAMNAVWDALVSDQVYKEQLDKAGIVVGENDVWQTIISNPSLQNNPTFQNEAGLFDEEIVKEFIANMQEDAAGAPEGSAEKNRWLNWLADEDNIRKNIVRSSYNSLVSAGLGASLEEGKRDYLNNNVSYTSEFVYIPYTSIADSLITITNSDYKNYIKDHSKEFQVEKSRDIKYIKFDIVASEDDKKEMKTRLSEYISDMKSSADVVTFINDLESDLPINNNFVYKSNLPKNISEEVLSANIGDVVGPYEENGHFKLSKVIDIKKMPDSVNASHILIPYLGLRSAGPDITQTEFEAKKTADSILAVVKRNKSKFKNLAKEFSADKSNSDNGGKLDWFSYTRMVPEFRDYSFLNKKGDIGIVKSPFGFHIVKIEDQKNFSNAVKLATFSKEIVASDVTEAKFYQDAETFASEISKGGSFDDLAKENEYKILYGKRLAELAEIVPGLTGNQRQIIRWSFENNIDVNDIKRFDIDNGYVVAMLTKKTDKGTAKPSDVAGQIKQIILKNKKVAMITNKMNGETLKKIAADNRVVVKNSPNVTLVNPMILGVGREVAVIGAMSTAEEGKVIKGIEGVLGVFAIKVVSKEIPAELDNYGTFRNKLSANAKSKINKMYTALKEVSDIEDNRAVIY